MPEKKEGEGMNDIPKTAKITVLTGTKKIEVMEIVIT